MANAMLGSALILIGFACAAIEHDASDPQDVLSSLLLSLQPTAGWQVVANAAGTQRTILQRVQGQPKLSVLPREERAPLSEQRRRLLLAAAASTGASLLPREAYAVSAALQQLEVNSDYVEALEKKSEYIVKASELSFSKLPGKPDYISLDIDLPLSKKVVEILQPWGKVKTSMRFEDGISSDDTSGLQVWNGGIDLCRGGSTGQLRMSPDGKVKPVITKGKRVLELGSGTGIAGIGVALGGANLVMTDGNLDVLGLVKKNLDYNKVSGVDVARLRWGNREDEEKVFSKGPFDIVMAAEVGYDQPWLDEAFGTLSRCMMSAKKAGVADPLAVLQVSLLEEGEDNQELAVQTRKTYLDAAKKFKLKLTKEQEINESFRLVFALA